MAVFCEVYQVRRLREGTRGRRSPAGRASVPRLCTKAHRGTTASAEGDFRCHPGLTHGEARELGKLGHVPVVLIRHADAGNRQDWTGDDHLRPLSSRGRGQANRLVATLRPWSPQRVLSSPYTRCVETVDPLARSLGLEVEITKNLAEGVGAEALALLRAVADEKVALCTHGDVIAEILVALADEDRLNLGPKPRQSKGSAWVLQAVNGTFLSATYLAPDR